MPEQVHAFDELATRDGFNRSLRHFKFISRVIGDFESKRNIADILGQCLADKSVEPRQVLPTLNAILVDKYHYSCRSHNLAESFEAFDGLAATVATWKAVDLVVAYFHPELGVVVVNPKNRDHWEGVRSLKKNELVTVFAGAFAGTNGENPSRPDQGNVRVQEASARGRAGSGSCTEGQKSGSPDHKGESHCGR